MANGLGQIPRVPSGMTIMGQEDEEPAPAPSPPASQGTPDTQTSKMICELTKSVSELVGVMGAVIKQWGEPNPTITTVPPAPQPINISFSGIIPAQAIDRTPIPSQGATLEDANGSHGKTAGSPDEFGDDNPAGLLGQQGGSEGDDDGGVRSGGGIGSSNDGQDHSRSQGGEISAEGHLRSGGDGRGPSQSEISALALKANEHLGTFGLIGADGHAHGLPDGKPIKELFDGVFAKQRKAIEDRDEEQRKQNDEAALLLLLGLGWTDAEKASLLHLVTGYAGEGAFYASDEMGIAHGQRDTAIEHATDGLTKFSLLLIDTVNQTTAKRLADAFAAPESEANPVVTVFADSPQRSQDIGDNESSRAFHAGIDAVGKVTGLIKEKKLITQEGACPICVALEAGGWIPFDQAFASDSFGGFEDTPIHDRCRCSVLYRYVKT